eukprot:9132917-Alexandrium_andersonii.AAC.1
MRPRLGSVRPRGTARRPSSGRKWLSRTGLAPMSVAVPRTRSLAKTAGSAPVFPIGAMRCTTTRRPGMR